MLTGVEVAERMSYYGIASNLITYLTNVLHQSTATAAKNVNIWSGVTATLPFLGAFLADAYWGRYKTIVASSIVYLLVSCSNPHGYPPSQLFFFKFQSLIFVIFVILPFWHCHEMNSVAGINLIDCIGFL